MLLLLMLREILRDEEGGEGWVVDLMVLEGEEEGGYWGVSWETSDRCCLQ